MKVLRRSLIPWLGILALLLAACGPAATATPKPVAPTPTPAGPIKIGVLTTLTGALAVNGISVVRNIEWLLEQDGGQIAGRRVQLIPADDEGKLDVFMSKAKRLIEVDRVNLIVGPIHSGIAAGAQDWMGTTPIPWVVPEVGTVQFYPPPNAVRTAATSGHHWLPELGKYLAETYGIKKGILVGLDYAAGRDYVEAAKETYKGGNIEVIQEFFTPVGTPDFGPIIAKMKLDEAQVISGALWGSDAVRFIRQAEEFGVKKKVKLVFSSAFALDDMGMPALGKAAEGILNYFDLPPPGYPTPEMERYADAFKLKFGSLPGYSWRGLTAYTVVKQAIESVKGNVEDSQALIKAVRQPVKLPTGVTITFDKCGNAVLPIFLKEIKMVGGIPQSTLVKDFPNKSIPCPSPWKK